MIAARTTWEQGYEDGSYDARNLHPHRFPQGSREDDFLAGYDAGYRCSKYALCTRPDGHVGFCEA